ncbi:MAG: alpha-amylase [Chloroflexi bacterium]|nr:alpha-amylase [Chloroflexota bacterium]
MKHPWQRCSALLALLILAACTTSNAGTPTVESPPPTETAVVPTPTAEPAPTGPWWNETVFYEVFVRSFKDSDGDGVGDINGLIEKLDYLNDGDPDTTTDLGVTGIWLMPIMESPSYHGYDVVDYYAVDQEYGTKEDFLRLVGEAHKRGIRVILDLVLNHTGTGHPWFKESNSGNPDYRDWYVWADEAPNYKGPWGQQVWYAGKDGYYYAVFWSQMPDLNLENPKVTAEIENITRFWLEDMGADGFRMDAIKHFVEQGPAQENTPATHAWLQAFHQSYKSINPQAFAVGEAWTLTPQVVDYIGDEVDVAFEFDLAGAFVRSASGPIAASAIANLDTVVNSYPPGQYGVFLTNHDQDRVMSVLKDVQKAKLAAVMLLTSPGVPFIYYGEEIGMTGVKPDENIRRPMQWSGENSKVGFSTHTPWNAAARDYKETNVARQTDDPDSLLSLYRDLIHLRNTHAALRTGETLVVDADTQRLYAALRYNDDEAFLILVNVHPKPLTADLYNLTLEAGPFIGPLKAVSVLGLENPAAPEINANGGFSGYTPFQEIPAETAVIIQLTP